ncbi:MAG: spore coat protein [Clostridia bacterium]|nr:spore coat protein [Clostridia bacterium]
MNYEKKAINEVKRRGNNDYLEIENSEGMPGLVDSTVALDFLLAVKSGIRNCAIAISETASTEVRSALRRILDGEIDLHIELSELMMSKGWLYPYEMNRQFRIDEISTQTALQIASLKLFPGDTDRLGTFATPKS